MKAIFMRWIPWSGKSTKARELAKESWAAIFSRDDVRKPELNEGEVIELENQFMAIWHENIIIDNTHINLASLEKRMEYAASLWYEVEVVDMEDQYTYQDAYYLEASRRNLERIKDGTKFVPWCVVDKMFLQSHTIDEEVVIVDIDGTIANLDHRLHFVQGETKDRDWFFAWIKDDLPIHWVINAINTMSCTKIIVSWRPDTTRADTKEWLEKNDVDYDFLLMRSGWDRRPDYQVKRDIYNQCLSELDIICVFDDRPEVCELRKELDLPLIQLPWHG